MATGEGAPPGEEVAPTAAQRVITWLMFLNGGLQLVWMALSTLVLMLAVGGLSTLMFSWGGSAMSTGEEALVAGGAVGVVLLMAAAQFVSGLGALVAARGLWRRQRSTRLFVACGVSALGPMVAAAAGSMSLWIGAVVALPIMGLGTLAAFVAMLLAAWAAVTVSTFPSCDYSDAPMR